MRHQDLCGDRPPRLINVLGFGSVADEDLLVANIILDVIAKPKEDTTPARCLEAVDRCRVVIKVLFVHHQTNADLLEV